MQEFEKQRLAGAVDQKLSAKKQLNTAGSEAVKYDVDLTVTKYEKGNAFARAMLAGLGQIHIDASVRLVKTESKEKVSEFLVSKTFAWGGLYGGMTRIEDVEPAFAEGIAAALTGQSDNSQRKSN